MDKKLTIYYAFEVQLNYKKAIDNATGKNISEYSQSNEWINQINQKQIEAAESYLNIFIKPYVIDDDEKINLLVNLRDKSPDLIKCLVDYQISELCHRVTDT